MGLCVYSVRVSVCVFCMYVYVDSRVVLLHTLIDLWLWISCGGCGDGGGGGVVMMVMVVMMMMLIGTLVDGGVAGVHGRGCVCAGVIDAAVQGGIAKYQ